jgi:hypothetical protein
MKGRDDPRKRGGRLVFCLGSSEKVQNQ